MATRRTKNGDDEKLDSANLDKVIRLLEPQDPAEKPITKKDACAILNIAYNTARLNTLIEKHKEKKAKDKERRAALRGKPATETEIQFVIQEYLEGATVDSITQKLYRSSDFVLNILDKYGVPRRQRAHDYFKPELIPEEAMRDRFNIGDIVYSARYDSIAEVKAELFQNNQFVYRIWLLSQKWSQSAYQEAAELASLDHLTKLGIKFA